MQDLHAELYKKLVEAETDITNGDEGEDFFEFADKLRKTINGQVAHT